MNRIILPVESDGQGGIKNVSYAVGNQARLALPAVTAGFTPIVTSVDTRKIYVSTSGDDSNDGLSSTRPIKSITYGVSSLRSGFPDHFLLKRGDRFRIAPKGASPFKVNNYSRRPNVVQRSLDLTHSAGLLPIFVAK